VDAAGHRVCPACRSTIRFLSAASNNHRESVHIGGYLRARPRAVVTRSDRGDAAALGCRRRPSRGGGDAITRDPSTAYIRPIRADGSQAHSPHLRADDAHRVPPIALPDFTTSSHIRVARGWLIRTTGRLRPGRSWHNRRCSRDRGITGNSRRDPLNTSSRMRHCQEFPGTQAQPQPAFRDPAGALWIGPREATDRHDQHKPTQPAPGWRGSETVLREQKPQVKGHITGSRDRTRTYNLPVNRRSVLAGSAGGCQWRQPVLPA
jgi:hypothetical protein